MLNPNPTKCLLLLPSLDNSDPILLTNVSKETAIHFVNSWNELVKSKRKVRDGAPTDQLEFYSGNFGLPLIAQDADGKRKLEIALERLAVSTIRESRGRRALFVDLEGDEVGVGTTVIYNENRAASGVTDNTVTDTILKLVSEFSGPAVPVSLD